MSKSNSLKIAIDIRRKRIRLNKNVLELIGYPEYIQLLVNPDSRKIVLMASIETKTAHKIYGDRTKGYELTSLGLIRSLKTLCPEWTDDNNYHIPGRFIGRERILEFEMDQSIPYKETGDCA